MNNIIRECAVKAGLISDEYNGFDRTNLTSAETLFAELLIAECVGICESQAASAQAQQESDFLTDAGRQLYSGVWGGAKGCSGAIAALMIGGGIMGGDGGYEIGSLEQQQEFENKRNKG